MTDAPWTLGLLKARNMQIHALCENAQCGHISIADTDLLITHFGPDKLLSDFDGMQCETCGGALKIMIGFNDPEDECGQ